MPWYQKTLSLRARKRGFHLVTSEVVSLLPELSSVRRGILHLFIQHTSASLTINENADPSVQRDILYGLDKMAPERGDYRHGEGNSPAHIKSSLVGASATVIVEEGRLILGTWQSVFFCEFDGPRRRTVYVKFIPG